MLFIFILGLLIGSFLNVCIYRIPKSESIVFGHSHCTNCNTAIAHYDLIPLLSYIFLGGCCRTCHTSISIRYPLIELLNAILYVLIYFLIGPGLYMLSLCFLSSTLLVASFIDIDTLEVPNGLVAFVFILGILHLFTTSSVSILNAFLGFLVGGLTLLIIAILSKGNMGGGDIKLLAACGLFLGPKYVIVTIFVAALLATLYCIPLLLLKSKGIKDELPFVPFLASAIMIVLLVGDNLISWYWSLFL